MKNTIRVVYNIILVFLAVIMVFVCSCCGQQKNERLRILIDLGITDPANEIDNLRRALQYLGGLEPEKLEIEALPVDDAERTVRIQALRTEIMSGGGPDVFLMTCNFSGWRFGKEYFFFEEKENSYLSSDGMTFQRERLFPDVGKCMENHLFLSLDDFFKEAAYFDPDMILPPVLEAGKTEEGQQVLPIMFTFPTAVYQKELIREQGTFPTSWQEAADSSNHAAQKAYGVAAWNQFSDIFSQIVDSSGWSLSVSRKELTQIVKEAISLSNTNLLTELQTVVNIPPYDSRIQEWKPFPEKQFGGFLCERAIDYWNIAFWSPGFYDYRWEPKEHSQIIEPIRNIDGGVTAGITTYACINRNTKHSEEAFKVLDILFCTDAQNGIGATVEGYPEKSWHAELYYNNYGIPARNDLMQNGVLSFQQAYVSQAGIHPGPNEEAFSEYTALRNEVTHARFYGALDQELQTMYEACLEAKTDEEIEKIVSKAYDTMLMILAES